MTTIEIEECPDTVTALYGEGELAYMELDPDTWTLSCYSTPDDGSTPEGVYFRRRLRWSIPTYQGAAANELMASEEVQRLAVVICDGYENDGYSDGSGRYSEDAEDAIHMMEYAIEQHDGRTCYGQDAADCFATYCDLPERIENGEWDSLDALIDWMHSEMDEHGGYDFDGDQIVVEDIQEYAESVWEAHAPEETSAA